MIYLLRRLSNSIFAFLHGWLTLIGVYSARSLLSTSGPVIVCKKFARIYLECLYVYILGWPGPQRIFKLAQMADFFFFSIVSSPPPSYSRLHYNCGCSFKFSLNGGRNYYEAPITFIQTVSRISKISLLLKIFVFFFFVKKIFLSAFSSYFLLPFKI